jgi:hypothetical protein
MVVLEQDPGGTCLVERRPREPVALAGVLFLALGLLPLVSEGSLTVLRVATALSLSAVAACCFVLGLPRSQRRPLPERSSIQRLALSGTSDIEGYAVDAIPSSGPPRRLLSGADPGRVLTDGLALSAELGVPLSPGWGLGPAALGVLASPASAPRLGQRLAVSHRIVADQAIGAGTALWAAAFIPAATLVLAISPARPSLTPTTLAFVLPGLTALYALAVGLWLLGLREKLTLDAGRITRRRDWFGRPFGHALETPGVVGLYAVAPLGAPARHLLAATRAGPVALPTEPQAATALSSDWRPDERPAGRAAE